MRYQKNQNHLGIVGKSALKNSLPNPGKPHVRKSSIGMVKKLSGNTYERGSKLHLPKISSSINIHEIRQKHQNKQGS